MMGLTARLARRPWKESERGEWSKTGAAKEVFDMKHRKLKKLIAVIEVSLGPVPRNVAMANVKMILKPRTSNPGAPVGCGFAKPAARRLATARCEAARYGLVEGGPCDDGHKNIPGADRHTRPQ